MSRRVLNYSHICKVGKKCESGQRTNERIAWPDNTQHTQSRQRMEMENATSTLLLCRSDEPPLDDPPHNDCANLVQISRVRELPTVRN